MSLPRWITGLRMGALLVATMLTTGASGAVYVVDGQHPAADDGNPGTRAQPLRTVSVPSMV